MDGETNELAHIDAAEFAASGRKEDQVKHHLIIRNGSSTAARIDTSLSQLTALISHIELKESFHSVLNARVTNTLDSQSPICNL